MMMVMMMCKECKERDATMRLLMEKVDRIMDLWEERQRIDRELNPMLRQLQTSMAESVKEEEED